MAGGKRQTGGGGGWLGALIAIGLVIAAVMWVLSFVGHPLGLTPAFHEVMDKHDGWVGKHYQHAFWGYVLTFAFICAVGVASWVGYVAATGSPADSAIARGRLRQIASFSVLLLIAIAVLPIGPRNLAAGPTRDVAQARSAFSDSAGSADEDTSALADERAARRTRRLRHARQVRRLERERRVRREVRSRRARRHRALLLASRTSPGSQEQPAPDDSAPAPKDSRCDPSYSGCLDPNASDYDCAGGSGDGPKYVQGPLQVLGDDHYDLERDGDGIACDQ